MRAKTKERPAALTIAGSDSGGGAGIQADLKTFAALNAHGTSAITCVTAQNPGRVTGVGPCKPDLVLKQIEAVFAEFRPAAVKTGMLFSSAIIRVVAEFFQNGQRPPLIVDPVMVATSGARLLEPSASKKLKNDLLPLAALVTPNLPEAGELLGRKLKTPEDMRWAAREIHRRFGCAALVKGGHLRSTTEAVDIFFDGKTELLLTAPFLKGVSTHGTGCTYSAAIAAFVARGCLLDEAVQSAKQFITDAIACSYTVRGHSVLNPLGD